MDAALDAEPGRVQAADRSGELDLLRMKVLTGELRQRLQLPRERRIQAAVAVPEARRRVPHLQIEIRRALPVVQITALRALETFRRIEVMHRVAPRTVLAFQLQKFGLGPVAHTAGNAFPESDRGGGRPAPCNRSMPSATAASVSYGVYGMDALSQNAANLSLANTTSAYSAAYRSDTPSRTNRGPAPPPGGRPPPSGLGAARPCAHGWGGCGRAPPHL